MERYVYKSKQMSIFNNVDDFSIYTKGMLHEKLRSIKK